MDICVSGNIFHHIRTNTPCSHPNSPPTPQNSTNSSIHSLRTPHNSNVDLRLHRNRNSTRGPSHSPTPSLDQIPKSLAFPSFSNHGHVLPRKIHPNSILCRSPTGA